MKFTVFVVTTLASTADFALAADYQPALRALATPEPAAADAGKYHEWWEATDGEEHGVATVDGNVVAGVALADGAAVWGWWTLILPSDVNQLLHTCNV
ncbi:hypothetical protein PsorP6_001084 [Peronosclerospora sorghi]|uniref:Uncharacterized protein n=1 Tax=Peronosclerospora sorghi TaxID=230839 RepID=A0ACC0WSM4_9STRA|nr:hypothetical protein PsorP6_001084 [Peronosclerospora sorghi]